MGRAHAAHIAQRISSGWRLFTEVLVNVKCADVTKGRISSR